MTDTELEIVRRYASWNDKEAGKAGIEWFFNSRKNLTVVSTEVAFALARGGMDVMCIDEDADYALESDFQDEHYPDKSKSYPDIETIFVLESAI